MFEFMRYVFHLTLRGCREGLTERMTHNRLKIARLPAYPQFIELGKQREGAIFLDMGCCCM